ncbi:response regulator receiver domain-containing protein [Tahibacter aquaticus]|uniref:Response regulator receiver domain-containing protein n=1 Tax=Tahibacter aquaticus TaxID=520092 RepID=A0A4R6Z532_9GAMM|nr:response regulator receiver domain-containing protein [Tahibacter aquaticus]
MKFTLLAEEGSRSSGGASPENHRVLLVEDQPDVARVTALGLAHLGVEVRVAATGSAALEQALAFRPTLVLLDLDLPDFNGHEVARRLRAQREFDAVWLVALTSWNTPDMRQRSVEAGMVEHLAKPIDLDVLARLLARLPRAFL